MPNQFQPRFWDKDNQLLGCSWCSEHKSYDSFHVDSTNKFGRAYYCKACANAKSRNFHNENKVHRKYKDKQRNGWIKRAHKLTLIEYTEKLIAQGSKCAICGVELLTNGHLTHLDHNHINGKLRDFLCTNCNRGLGHFQDSPELLAKAKAYLEFHNTDVDCVKEGTHL
jgi:hypothetical protein